MDLLTILIIITLIVIIRKYSTRKHSFFRNRGIPYIKAYPFVGSMGALILRQKSWPEWSLEAASEFSRNRFFGIIDFREPRLVIKDPDLIKKIGIKDFDHFVDHQNFGEEKSDPLFANSLFNMKGQKWRDMRATLSPAFTGSKMRMMFGLVDECGEEFVQHFLKKFRDGEQPLIVDIKHIISLYAVNVISTCACGIKVDCLTDPNNEVYVNCRKALNFNEQWTQMKFIFIQMMPKLSERLGISLTPKQATKFFFNLVSDTIKHRKSTNTFRPDIIQLLIQAMEGSLRYEEEKLDEGFATVTESEVGKRRVHRNWSDVEIAAQAFVFFVAGFESVSSTIHYVAYELALDRELQEALIEEIDAVKNELKDAKITYDRLQRMEFLDAVLSEALRKYPPGFIMDRVCDKPFILEDYDGKKYQMLKGEKLWIDVYALHHNYEYFPNPMKFDPYRFLGENKSKILPNTYLPFGIGPRNCIGARFALMEAKAFLFHLLSEFTLEVCQQTPIPLRFQRTFGLLAARTVYLEMRPRRLQSKAH